MTYSLGNFTTNVNRSWQPPIVSNTSSNDYPQLDAAVDAKYHLAQTYEKMGDAEWAKDWLVDLVQNHQSHPTYERGHANARTTSAALIPDLEVPDLNGLVLRGETMKLAKLQPNVSLLQTHFLPPISFARKSRLHSRFTTTVSRMLDLEHGVNPHPQVPLNASTRQNL